MEHTRNIYRKNFSLIIIFLVLISVIFIIALFVSYDLNKKYVENEFSAKKIDVWEQTIKPYYNLFLTKIPEITSYQGYLDSTSAGKYAETVLRDYPFVKQIVFYDMLIGNQKNSLFSRNNLGVTVKAIYQYQLKNGKLAMSRARQMPDEADFKQMAAKLTDYITYSDTTRGSTQEEIFRTFYLSL